jgi:hypothetical protein
MVEIFFIKRLFESKFNLTPKKAFECFEFGRIAYNQKDYLKTCKWMRQALRLIETSENDTSLAKEEEILDFYAYSASKVRKLSVFNTSYVYFCQKFNSFFYTLI